MRHKIRKILCLCLVTAMIGGILTESDYAIFARAEETTSEAPETDISAVAESDAVGDDSMTSENPGSAETDNTAGNTDNALPEAPGSADTDNTAGGGSMKPGSAEADGIPGNTNNASPEAPGSADTDNTAGDDSTTPDTSASDSGTGNDDTAAADGTVTGDDSTTPDIPAADDPTGSNDSLTADDTSGEILPPEKQELPEGEESAKIEDTTDVEQIGIKNKVSYVSGASRQENGKLVWTPSESAAGHAFVYEADYTINGSGTLAPGTVRITLPLHILKDRENNWADSFECPYPIASEVTEGDTPEFTYVTDEEANTATLTNYKEVTAGQTGFIEFSYTTTKSTLDYVDMAFSDKPYSTLEITKEDGTPLEPEQKVTFDEVEAVAVNTHAEILWTKKNTPTFYSTWQDSWGTVVRPKDAEKYNYLIWTVESYVGDNTSPYSLTLEDLFGDQDMGGGVVGYRFAGQNEFQSENFAENLRGSRYRYDYILTRHEKTKASYKTDEEGFYILHNEVTATVTSVDRIDAPTSASSSADWRYNKPTFDLHDYFNSWKNGLYNGESIVYSSSDVSSYQLGQFMEKKTDRINGLRYHTWFVAYPYPWTLENGTGTHEDAENGGYGKKKVEYQFVDDTFALEGKPLADEDYEITDVSLAVTMRDAEYNSETYTFQEKAIEEYKKEDNVTLQVRNGSNSWQNAAVYDMASGSFIDQNPSLVKDISGRVLTFASGIKGVRLTCSNAYYFTQCDMTPTVSLLSSEHTKAIIGKKDLVSLTNTSVYQVSQQNKEIFSRSRSSTDHIRKVTPRSDIRKEVTATRNDKRKRRYLVTWRIRQSEFYQDDDGSHYIGQQSGIFYDLLPAGAGLDRSSIVVQAGSTSLNTGAYTVETKENYQDTGRTLLKVSVSEPTDTTYQMSYQTVHAYNAIQDFSKNLLNSAAYETGNDDITGGSPDDGGQITEKDLMAGLDPDHLGDKFLYAECRHNITILMSGNSGLMKQVKTEKDADYRYETTVGQGGAYTYQLRVANDKATRAKNLILFDSLEYFYREDTDTPTITSDWYGKLTSIDLSGLTAKGIQPVVYLSDEKGLNINRYHDLTEKKADGTPRWLEYSAFLQKYGGLDAAHAVAIDASRKKDSSAFILEEGKSMVVTLYMKAPEKDSSGKTDPVTYNNIYLEETLLSENDEAEQEKFIHQDYTRIHYRITGNLQLRKVDETDSTTPVRGATYLLRGTSDYGTVYETSVTTGRDGSLSYEGIEKGTYELLEISCTDDWLLDTEVYRVTVDNQGKVTVAGLANGGEAENPVWLLKDSPRIHADLQIRKKDSVSSEPVNSAEFLLTGTSDYGTDVLIHAASEGKNASGNASGIIMFQNLELGTYKLTEVAAPDGYILNKVVWTVKVDERGAVVLKDEDGKEVLKDSSNYYYEISNEPLHKVTFLKTSSYGTGVTLEKAEFSLTGVSDYGTNVEKTAVSNQEGLVEITGLEPGTYLLRETKAPENYELNTTVYPVTVKSDGTFIIEGLEQIKLDGTEASLYNFKDDPTGGIVKIIKVWKDDGPDDEKRPEKLDIAISTTKPSKDTRGYTLTLDANGGTFADGSKENNLVYTSGSITPISGTYGIPTSNAGNFVGWYNAKTGGTKFEGIDQSSGTLTAPLTADMTLYARYKPAMKYAVAIYGIGVDVMADEKLGGLTFGPALGADYVTTSKPAHTRSNDLTNAGNAHRCVHEDSWEEIIKWNKIDPYVYEECIAEGCTKSVPLTENGTTTILNPYFDTSPETGDGPSVLWRELSRTLKNGIVVNENMRWRPNDPAGGDYGSNQGGWGASRIRAMLNGADDLTDKNDGTYAPEANSDENRSASIYTKENCLLATFPQELQNAIGSRKVPYGSGYGEETNATPKTSSDKLWLFSWDELEDTSNKPWYGHVVDGTVYQKFENLTFGSGKFTGYCTGEGYPPRGEKEYWWLRTTSNRSKNAVYQIGGADVNGKYEEQLSPMESLNYLGVAPGFTLR